MRAAAITLAAAALLSGCGQLTVRVDVLNPNYVQSEMAELRLHKLYREISAAQAGEFAARVDRNFAIYQREVTKLAKLYEDVSKKLPDPQGTGLKAVADGLTSAVSVRSGVVVSDAARHGSKMEELAQGIRTLGADLKWSDRSLLPTEMREKLVAFEAEDKSLEVKQLREVRALVSGAAKVTALTPSTVSAAPIAAALAPELKAVTDQAAVVASVAQRSIIGDGSLAATEFAYVVANAPENLWVGNFNRAFASGTFGNSDIVIRLNSTADFSIKGMLFDATKVAQVASKLVTQAVLISAQMSGVPVSSSSTGTQTGGDALSKASVDLGTADAAIAKRQALAASQRDAVRAMARTIVGAAMPLESDPAMRTKPKDDPARVPLHKAIDDAVTALKPLLALQDLQ